MTGDLFGVMPSELQDERDCWRTPRKLFEALDREFHFTWDLAADAENAKCELFYTIDDDALAQRWGKLHGPCWLNPPFSRLAAFVEKASRSAENGGPTIVMLMPITRNEQPWFHRWVVGRCAELRFIETRTPYVAPPGVKQTGPKFGSQIVIFDPARFGECKLGSQ